MDSALSLAQANILMKAIMLAAGIGSRLGNPETSRQPKVLLQFDGRSLLERHIDFLQRQGIDELILAVGFNRVAIEQEIESLGASGFVRTVVNPDFEAGSILTLWALRDELCSGGPALLMDADVLYEEQLLDRLVSSRHNNCALLDRVVIPDEEAVKLCIRDGEIVEFRKWVSTDFDFNGESVGFFKLSPEVAHSLVSQTQLYVEQGRRTDPYEEPLRDVMLTSPPATMAYEDITGMPWIEIDSAADLKNAHTNILPRMISSRPTLSRHAGTSPTQLNTNGG
jgi:choline kinase